jgi:hypothetical protein
MGRKLTRRDFLRLSGAAGTTIVAGSAMAGCGDGSRASTGPIVRYGVHPKIGITRVGNAAGEFFLAPDLPGETPEPPGGFKDGSGAIKRQACRFRVYGYDADGVAVREITADEAEIEWSVHVANRKAAWYDFETPLDIPEAIPVSRRNFSESDRGALTIDPGARSLSGRDRGPERFDGGTFLGQEIDLGEMLTDEHGRLVVLAGRGGAYNPTGAPLTTFANNRKWCDDIADGPVRATIRIGDAVFEAEPGWVAAAPPNYGPSLPAGFVSMYDVVEQVMVEEGFLEEGGVSFAAHILPLFLRLGDMQWVNQGVYEHNGFGSPENLEDPVLLARLADPGEDNAAFRQSWFERFRNPDYRVAEPDALPPMYGDDTTIPASSPRQWLAPTDLQYRRLERWAAGDFDDDFDVQTPIPEYLEELPPAEQPFALDRAGLEPVLGGAFHPGTEITWILRTPRMFDGLFQLRTAAPGRTTEQDFGPLLTPERAIAADGPLALSGPGDLTRWMAVPWHTDTASCRSGYQPEIDPYLPTFWPARVPNDVLTEAEYERVMDPSLPDEERRRAFGRRAGWLRAIARPDYTETLALMIEDWPRLGVIAGRPGPGGDIAPERLKVEVESGFPEDGPTEQVSAAAWADALGKSKL